MNYPLFSAFEDLRHELKFRIEREDGTGQDILIPKNMAAGRTPLTTTEYETLIKRNFDIGTSQSLVVGLSGGIGDLAIQIDATLRMKSFLRNHSNQPFEFFAYITPERVQFMRRFFEHFSIFDGFKATDAASGIKLKYKLRVLRHITDGHTYVDHFSLGTAHDYCWALWGLPGRSKPIEPKECFEGLDEITTLEHAKLRTRYSNFPQNQNYLLFCPEANTSKIKKSWPLKNWVGLTNSVLNTSANDIVFIAIDPMFKEVLGQNSRVVFINPVETVEENDFLRLISVINGSRLIVSVDSGPAHVAGLIGKACITLWGPTNPVLLGHTNNLNLRVSHCTPCGLDDVRSRLCFDNICMKQILPDSVIFLVQESLNGRYLPR